MRSFGQTIKNALAHLWRELLRMGRRHVGLSKASSLLNRVPMLKAALQGAAATTFILLPAIALCIMLNITIPWLGVTLFYIMVIVLNVLAGPVEEIRKHRGF